MLIMVYWNCRQFCWTHLLNTLFLKIRNASFIMCQVSIFTWIYFWTWYILFHWFISWVRHYISSYTLFWLLLFLCCFIFGRVSLPYWLYFSKNIDSSEHFLFPVNWNINLCGFMKIRLTFFLGIASSVYWLN